MPTDVDLPPPLEMGSVLFVDIVGFSRHAIEAQRESLRQLQEAVRSSADYQAAEAAGRLTSLPTGDGMALIFTGDFLASLRCAVQTQLRLRQQSSVSVRIGIHIGPLLRHTDIGEHPNVVGGGINIAQRVMDCGDAGHILLSSQVAEVLEQTSEWAPFVHDLGEVSVKHGVAIHLFNLVRGEAGNPARPSKLAAEPAPESSPMPGGTADLKTGISRRVMLAGTAAAGGTFLAGWLGWPRLESLIHPLPKKRYVALMIWPANTAQSVRPILTSVLDAMSRALERAESAMREMLVLRAGDVAGAPVAEPKETVHALGANLVLTAALERSQPDVSIWLRVLEPASGRVLRERRISERPDYVAALPDKAAKAALGLLQVPSGNRLTSRRESSDDNARVRPDAWQAYIAGEDLAREPNDSHLNEAISKYQQAIDLDPQFGLAWARLAIAYLRRYQHQSEPATLRLAQRNAERASALAPDSAQTLLAAAEVDLFNGRTERALAGLARARGADPANTDVLMYQAVSFRYLDRPEDEEAIYRAILQQRPNYWPAYNDLGAFLYRHGRLEESLKAFEEASAVVPSAVLPLVNAGSILLALRRRDEAIALFERSLREAPNERALINLGNLAYEDKAYRRALNHYRDAAKLNPRSHEIYRDIGDCYQALGNEVEMVASYARASDLLQAETANNSRSGARWMRLAFYDAKAHRIERVAGDMEAAEQKGASDIQSQFLKAQALAVIGKNEQAAQIVLACVARGLSPVEVELAPDLAVVRSDSRYHQKLATAKARISR